MAMTETTDTICKVCKKEPACFGEDGKYTKCRWCWYGA